MARVKKRERQQLLIEAVNNKPFLTDEELAKQLEVSVQTIRLDRLELGIPELRGRIRKMAENAQNKVKSIQSGEVVGEKIIKKRKIIKEDLFKSKELLDNVNGYSLDKKQRLAVIDSSDSALLLAGAGSGKTLTIVGKIRYLIEILKIKKEDILCISFTNDSVNSLKNALFKNYNYDIDVFTFHKLALNILKDNKNIVNIASSDELDYIITEYFYSNFSGLNILEKKKEFYELKKLIGTFINLFKSNNHDYIKFDEILKRLKYGNDYIFIKIVREIYIEYMSELKSKNEVDFNDMINDAIKVLNKGGKIKSYKYIIIDEYQDTSLTKYNLIKTIKNKTQAKLFCVGDDFQSIYRFTGCNLNIFLNFKKYYKNSRIMKIENTYRNCKDLIKVSGNFIMKNNHQMRKKLKSSKKLKKPIKIIYYKSIKDSFEKLILDIYSKNNNGIMVLGRNNNDIYKYLNSNFRLENQNVIYLKNENIKIRYLTVHKSKGLEEENVIIINLENKINGFPSKIENNEILKYVLNENDNYPYEEERRLFYVALTRTKNNVYLFVNKKNESIFVKEIVNNYKSCVQIFKNYL